MKQQLVVSPLFHTRHKALTLVTFGLLSCTSAQAEGIDLSGLLGGLGNIAGLLSQGGIMSMISMIPGLNFLAGLGPIMDIVKMIPGVDGLLNSIPGLSQILGLLGMGGGNLGPLNSQIQNISKVMTTVQALYGNVKQILQPQNYNDYTNGLNSLLTMAGSEKRITVADFKKGPRGAAQTVINRLADQQRDVVKQIAHAKTRAEITALKAQSDLIAASAANAQRIGDNVSALQDTQGLAEKTAKNVSDTLSYSTDAARALKDNKKIEDIAKISGSATLELLRMTAMDSATMTTALANQLKVQVNQAETLGQMLTMMQQERMEKAAAISNALKDEQARFESQQESETKKAEQVGDSFDNFFQGKARPLGLGGN